ncbi:MAG: D-arabinose 5-phosphate isomerase, partial [Candidatus Portiera sp.]|nr:D-arabinose 5-phosphate isomerase [Portiera sp.]
MDKKRLIEIGLRTLDIEERAINGLRQSIDESFALACQAMIKCKGRIVVIGLGKSGHIARKISATLS